MNYIETGFRAIYKHFISMPLDEKKIELLKEFPGIEKAQGFLAYGYIDAEAGLSLEVLALAVIDGESIEYLEPNDAISVKFRIGSVEDVPFRFEPDKDGSLRKKYAAKVSMIEEGYPASEDVEKTRTLGFLDIWRHMYFPDDVQVYLVKKGLDRMEIGWIRITGLEGKIFLGTLLIEPEQDYGVHEGDSVAFHIETDEENNRAVCVCDLTPVEPPKEEDYTEGKVLKEYLLNFNEKQDNESLLQLLVFLRDCLVWVPCTAILDKEDEEMLKKSVEGAKDNPDALIGKIFEPQHEIRFVPDVLQKGGQFFMPAFTTEEEMGEYGEKFSKRQTHMLEVIALARGNVKDVSGIVINAFTDEFLLPKELFETLETMPSVFAKKEEPWKPS